MNSELCERRRGHTYPQNAVPPAIVKAVWRFATASVLLLIASASVNAQQPTCVTAPEASRTCVDLILVEPGLSSQARTGASGFSPNDEPGNDSSAFNHVIRSLDLLVYEARYRVLNQDAQGLRLRFVLPSALDFANSPNPAFGGAPVPDYCVAGSTLVGSVLDCVLGSASQGVTRSALLYARPKFGTPDGTVVRLQAQIEASNQQSSGPVIRLGYQDALSQLPINCDVTRLGVTTALIPCGDVVSARSQFDLEMGSFSSARLTDRSARGPEMQSVALNSSIATVVGGAVGRAGYVLSVPIAIALPGDGSGAAPLMSTSSIGLALRLANSDGIVGFGELVGCGVNGNDDPVPNGTRVNAGWSLGSNSDASLRARRFPLGRIGLAGSTSLESVQDSGQMQCTQSVAGGDVGITIQPTASTFSPATFPSLNADGTSTARRYVFVGLVVLFFPAEPVLSPSSGGSGDGAVNVRFDIGQPVAGSLRAMTVGATAEPDAGAIDDGFGAVGTYDDDNNNFINASLDSVGSTYAKLWRNPRGDTDTFQSASCLRDGSDPTCRHGYAFPGANIQSLFVYNYRDFVSRPNVAFCDEWDSSRTRLRTPFDSLANPAEMPPGSPLILELGGLNSSANVLAAMGLTVEVSTDAGLVSNIDWQPSEPNRSLSRSQASAPECTSGTWVAASLPPLVDGLNAVVLPQSLEMSPGSGIYPAIKRIRIRATTLPPFVTVGLRGSYEVIASTPGTRLPNRTSFRFDGDAIWSYAENDHAIVRSADTSITLAATRNLSTGATAPISTITFGDTVEYVAQIKFSSGEASPVPSSSPLITKAYLPAGLDYVPGSAVPALAVAPYVGTNPETGQLATVLEWRITNPTAGTIQPAIAYQVRLGAGVGNSASLHTTAIVEHALDPSPIEFSPVPASNEDRIAVADIAANVPTGLLSTMTTTTPFIDLSGVATWQMGVVNTTAATFTQLRIINVLPHVGDAINSSNSFSGGYGGGSVTGLISGVTLYYSTSSPNAINRNPNCVSNGGTLLDGAAPCPAPGATWTLAVGGVLPPATTAVRIDDARSLAPNASNTFTLSLNTIGNRAGDVYDASFTATAPNQSLVVQSPRSLITIPAATLRGAVFSDNDASNTPTPADTGIPAVSLQLSGRDTQGNAYLMTTLTVSAQSAGMVANTISVNGGNAYAQNCFASAPLQRGEYLFCNLPSSDSAGFQLFEQQPADYLDRNEFVGTLASAQPPGVLSANDTVSGIRIRNDLVTGAADVGSGYLFAEYPIYATVSGRVFSEQSNPLNQIDNGVLVDPGLVTSLSIACVPASAGQTSVMSTSDGLFEFQRVPIGASCTITETLPTGYRNSYNLLGSGGVSETGGSGTVPSTISLVVPVAGSTGNVFAELQMTDTTSTISCSPTSPAANQIVTCSVICTNQGPGLAHGMSCEVTSRLELPGYRGGYCLAVSPVVPGDSLSCQIQFSMGSGLLEIRGGSAATNDSNGGTNPTAGNNPSSAPLIQSSSAVAPRDVPLPRSLAFGLIFFLLWLVAHHRSLRWRVNC